MYVNNQEFFMVWNPLGGAPTHQHQTEAIAIQEAKRLAKLNKGQQFIVLSSHCTVVCEDVSISYHDKPPF